MKYIIGGFLLVGMALLSVILYQTDLTEVWIRLQEVGWRGVAVIFIINFLISVADAASWHLALLSARLTLQWTYRLWTVMMVGEAINNVTPFVSLGGEPVKATLLNKRYGISYREAAVSLVLAQTIINIALAFFLLSGLVIMFFTPALPPSYRLWTGLGLITFSGCILLFFLVQRHKTISRVSQWSGLGGLSVRFQAFLDIVQDVEERLVTFYTAHRWRFASAVAFAFINWALGAVEIYYALVFLGHPITWADAWVIEAVVSLVRAALFVVPSNLGSQEGALFVLCGIITGSHALGIAVAVLRRFRELVWIGWGFAVGWRIVPKRSLSGLNGSTDEKGHREEIIFRARQSCR